MGQKKSSRGRLEGLLAYESAAKGNAASSTRAMLIGLGVATVSLGTALPAAAQPVYRRVDMLLTYQGFLQLDLNNDGVFDVELGLRVNSGYGSFRAYDLSAFGPTSGNSIAVDKTSLASAFKQGQVIGSANSFKPGGLMGSVDINKYSVRYKGNWRDVTNRYLGVKFLINGEPHYGWLRMSVTSNVDKVKLTGYAYETLPNTPITAGKDSIGNLIPSDEPLPPGSLGSLARGAASNPKANR